jgi:hypothetical protein
MTNDAEKKAKLTELMDALEHANRLRGQALERGNDDPRIEGYRREAWVLRKAILDLVFPPAPANVVPIAAGRLSPGELAKLNKKKPMTPAEWNSLYTEGTEVTLVLDDGRMIETKTRSEAWATGSGTPIVLVEGKSGGYVLNRVLPKSSAAPSQPTGSHS